MTIYTATIHNNDGASMKIECNSNTNYNKMYRYLKANYGKGWAVIISDNENDGEIVLHRLLRA